MKKVLFIVTEINSANGICTQAIMNKMIERNIEVYCITNKEYNFNDSYRKQNIKYFTVKPRLVYRISSILKHKKMNSFKYKILEMIYYIMNKIKMLISLPTWPLISPMYSDRIYKLAKQVCKEYEIDCIIPIYTQIDTLIAANKIKKENPNITYVPYFLDSLSGGHGPRVCSSDWVIRRGLKWENRLFQNADKIIVMSSSRKHHEKYSKFKKYYSKFVYLDIPLLDLELINKVNCKKEYMDVNKINIVYVGSLPVGIRNPRFILDLADCLDERYQLYFIGEKNCNYLNLKAKENNNIHIIGKCDRSIALQYEKEATILLNIGNNLENMVPSKIFEYISMKKPVISTYPIENEPSVFYLEKYHPCLLLDEKNNDFVSIQNQLDEFVKEMFNFKKINVDESFFYKNTPEAFINEIENLYK